MALVALTLEDLRPLPERYQSSRGLWEVLIGADEAETILTSVQAGDNAKLQGLLVQPSWNEIMLKKPHTIYDEDREAKNRRDVREVSAMPMSNITRALLLGAAWNQAPEVATLLDFAKLKEQKMMDVISRDVIKETIMRNHVEVMEVMAKAYPNVVEWPAVSPMDRKPISMAVRFGRTEMVAVLLKYGADAFHPFCSWDDPDNYWSLLSRAVRYDTRLLEMPLTHGLKPAGTGAMNVAASRLKLDHARLLLQHGADINEPLGDHRWTPLHDAAWSNDHEAMEFLLKNGADPEAKNKDGLTPAQLMASRHAPKEASSTDVKDK